MWYEKTEKTKLDYSKPIFAVSTDYTYILLPNNEGYDWFDLKDGFWNSEANWKTAEAAVGCYKELKYEIKNMEITLS